MPTNTRQYFSYSFKFSFLILVLINCLIFIVTTAFPTLSLILGLSPVLILTHKWLWQFVTYMFIHGSLPHLFSNMLGLLFFGYAVERLLGTKEFLLFYFTCGILSSLLSFLYYTITGQFITLLIGASGALYAVLFAYAVLLPSSSLYIWGILPIPSVILVLIYAAFELIEAFFNTSSNVAHFTHLFGFLAAFLYFLLRLKVNPLKVFYNTFHKSS